MSSWERTKGRLVSIDTNEIVKYSEKILKNRLGFSELEIKEMCNKFGYKDAWDMLRDQDVRKRWKDGPVGYVEINKKPYMINELEQEYDPDPTHCDIVLDDNYYTSPGDVFSFETIYYNGGTCWEEMVEHELNKILSKYPSKV